MPADIPPSQRIRVSFDVTSQAEADELQAAWQEIVSGKRTRLELAAQQLEEIMERARIALHKIVKSVEAHPRSGQARRLVAFLAGMYNGSDFPFDLTDLRALDGDLASACIDYLNYDRLCKVEVQTHMPGGGQQMQHFIVAQGLRPRIPFSSSAEHEGRLRAVAARARQAPDTLLEQALGDLLARYESKVFGGLLATAPAPDSDEPFFHARLLEQSKLTPLCGASDGPWTARAFEFSRTTCHECLAMALIDDELLA